MFSCNKEKLTNEDNQASKPIISASAKYLNESNLNILQKFETEVEQTDNITKKYLLNVASITFMKNEKAKNLPTNDIDYQELFNLISYEQGELEDYIISNNENISRKILEEIFGSKDPNVDLLDSDDYVVNSLRYLDKNYPSPNTRDACSDCIVPCLNYYRYSSIWYNYYYDVYYDCVNYNGLNCQSQAYYYAEHMININFCEPACEDECNTPCTDCPPSYNFDGSNCFLGKIPQGWDGYIDNNARKFYLKKKCCQICPDGFQYDNANCLFDFTFNPSIYDPFINTASDGSKHFYVEPDNNGNCPSGTYKDGAGNCYVGAVPSGYSPFIHDNKFYVEPHCYPNGNNCCPGGTSYDGKDCVMGTYPSGWQPFVYDGGFYVIPKCD